MRIMDNGNLRDMTPEETDEHNAILATKPVIPEYAIQRQKAYLEELGNSFEQLDMIYHNFEGWRQKVTAIKNRFPKS